MSLYILSREFLVTRYLLQVLFEEIYCDMDEEKRIKDRIKQKNYRERKAQKGFRCIQLYLERDSVSFLEKKIADEEFYKQDNSKQGNLDHIPVRDKTGYSDIINKILQDERHEGDKAYLEKEKTVKRNIKILKDEIINEILWKMKFSSLSELEIKIIISEAYINFEI